MAGIGFELKRLFRSRTVIGHVRAYAYSAMITAGPYALMTGMVLALQLMFPRFHVEYEATQLFMGVVVYSFVFSQLFSSGGVNILTRYVADCLSVENYTNVTSSLFGMWSITVIFGSLVSALFFYDKPLEPSLKLMSSVLFIQMLMLWVEGVYLSALKAFKRLFLSYVIGISVGLVSGYMLFYHSVFGALQNALFAMNAGIAVILLLFLVQIVHFFGWNKNGLHYAFLPHFEKHSQLGMTMYFFTLGMYLPNFIVWQSSWSVVVADTFRFSPIYDVVTFYAFLSILPLMTMFVVSAETSFYEKYQEYFSFITQKGNFREIDNAKKSLLQVLWIELRHMVEFQFIFTLIFLAIGTYVLSWSGITYSQVNMYNVLLIAAFFSGLLQVIMILMVYFDIKQEVYKIAVAFFLLNLIGGILTLVFWGETGFGINFLFAGGVSFMYCIHRLSAFCENINYYIFCSQPVFYRPPNGLLTRFVKWLYGDRYQDIMRGEAEE